MSCTGPQRGCQRLEPCGQETFQPDLLPNLPLFLETSPLQSTDRHDYSQPTPNPHTLSSHAELVPTVAAAVHPSLGADIGACSLTSDFCSAGAFATRDKRGIARRPRPLIASAASAYCIRPNTLPRLGTTFRCAAPGSLRIVVGLTRVVTA